jgi:cytidylate kinase
MKTFQDLQEGVYDPNILKAFFLAGGPGSGKSYVVKRTTGGLGMKVVNSDDAFEKLLKDAGLSLKMPPEEEEPRDVARGRAKELTAKRKANYVEGRLGLIIDGTGREFDKISKQARELEGLGYDTHMIFVNTSLDVALQRNEQRARSVPTSIVTNSWKAVQNNIGKFSNFFKGNFIIMDNNDVDEDMMMQVFKRVRSLATRKVQNSRGKAWISQQLQMKKRA